MLREIVRVNIEAHLPDGFMDGIRQVEEEERRGFSRILDKLRTDERIASTVGLASGEEYDKLRQISDVAKYGNTAAQEVLPKIGISMMVDEAWKRVIRDIKRNAKRKEAE